MARISGIDLPRDKKVEIGLTVHLRHRPSVAQEIIEKAGSIRRSGIRDLSDADVNKLRR
jgi:small subunit ribosomal protein S13